MSKIRIEVENLSKQYRLGQVGTGTISHDLNRFWHKVRGKEDPYSKIGAVNDRATKTEDKYVWALRDINFRVNEGDVLGIIGRNGAGKSTLLKILSRVTGPTEGQIKINGRIGALLEVGTGMHPELTGRENIFLNGAILGMTKQEIKTKFDEIVDFSGIAKYIDTPLKRYSSGMKVRLGFAVAAFLEPEILVVDEVLAVGDAEFQRRAIGKMQEVSKAGERTVLFVSHNMGSMRQLCNRGLLLENGSISYQGNIEDTIQTYLESSLVDDVDQNTFQQVEFIKANIVNVKAYSEGNREISKRDFLTSEAIDINIQYQLNPKYKNARIVMQVINSGGEIAFATTTKCQTHPNESFAELTATIPNDLLNGSIYYIMVHIGVPGVERLCEPKEFLKLNIETTGQHGSTFKEKWPGVVAPIIKWR
jgi:lipopolysaccharide transport system ATP-binding protein